MHFWEIIIIKLQFEKERHTQGFWKDAEKNTDYAEIFGRIMCKHALIMRKLHWIMREI